MSELLLANARLATMREGRYSIVDDAVLHVKDGRIEGLGPKSERARVRPSARAERIDLGGALVTPGLIDCHTHLVYAGDRAKEFEMRQSGATYEEIARAGGGIASTVKATRAATNAELREQSSRR